MICVNTFGLAHHIQDDMERTIQIVGSIGFDGIEPLVVPADRQGDLPKVALTKESFPVFWKTVQDLGLSVPSVHIFYEIKGQFLPVSQVSENLLWLCAQYDIRYFVFSGDLSSQEKADQLAGYLSWLAKALTPLGCHVVYHNHEQELHRIEVDGDHPIALDYFFSRTDPSVLLQLDIGWAGVAGDEVLLAEKYAGRICCLHLKDFVPDTRGNYTVYTMPEERFAAIGTGEIRINEVLALRKQFPNDNHSVIIDQDSSTRDMLEDLKTGFENVQLFLKE